MAKPITANARSGGRSPISDPPEPAAAKHSSYALGFHTLDVETSIDALPTRGTVPSWLTGTLVRVAPAKFEIGHRGYNHWFDGLAMLHKFAFAFHHVNAFEEADAVVVDLVAHADASVIDQLFLDRLRSDESVTATGVLTRFRIPASADMTGEALSSTRLELPRFNYARLAGTNFIANDAIDAVRHPAQASGLRPANGGVTQKSLVFREIHTLAVAFPIAGRYCCEKYPENTLLYCGQSCFTFRLSHGRSRP